MLHLAFLFKKELSKIIKELTQILPKKDLSTSPNSKFHLFTEKLTCGALAAFLKTNLSVMGPTGKTVLINH